MMQNRKEKLQNLLKLFELYKLPQLLCPQAPTSGAKYCDQRVCMSVCLFSHTSQQELSRCRDTVGHRVELKPYRMKEQ